MMIFQWKVIRQLHLLQQHNKHIGRRLLVSNNGAGVIAAILMGLALLASTILIGAVFPATAAPQAIAAPQRPFPQHLVYAPGTIRPNHRTRAQQDDDVRAAYDHWKASYLVVAEGTAPDGGALYRVTVGTTNADRTVSEGQGYGMMIVAIMAGYDPHAQTIFDGLWQFSRAYPSNIDNRLMGWQVPVDPDSNDSAFDGDSDIAYALLLADKQWGGDGTINYRAEAERVIDGILESTIGPTSRLPMLGDWVDPNGTLYNQYTPRSSDFMPGHFRAFGRATGNSVWTEVINASQTTISSIQSNFSPATGLLPDFIVPVSSTDHTPKPAPAGFLEGPHDGNYYYNAVRAPWRIGTDALLNNDAVSLAQTRKIANWAQVATSGVPTNIKPGYMLNGTPIPPGDYFTTLFAATLGVAAMTELSQQQFLNDIYDAVYNTYEDYYEDSVTLLCLLVMTGNYWDATIIDTTVFLPLIVR
jgi:endo-1,4-beta-D-glucanase Y